jgi:hypothetical protein
MRFIVPIAFRINWRLLNVVFIMNSVVLFNNLCYELWRTCLYFKIVIVKLMVVR